MTRGRIVRSLVLSCALYSAISAASPLPDESAIKTAQRAVLETYRDDLRSEEGLRRVLSAADGLAGADQVAAYLVVAKSAASSGLLRIGFDAIDRLARRFEYDAMEAKTRMLEGAVKRARSVEDRVSIVNRCLELLEQSVESERFDVGESALKIGGQAKIKDPALRKELADKRKAFDKLRKEFDAEEKTVDAARAALKRDERDPKANETMGKRLAVRGDWPAAIVRLGRAEDEGLRQAALNDAAATKDAGKAVLAADAWWSVAEGAEGKEERAFRARSIYWYSLAMPSLSGLAKARAEKRIEEAGKVDMSGQTVSSDSKVTIFLPGNVPLVLVKVPANDKVPEFWLGQTEATEAQWAAVMGGKVESADMPKVEISLNDIRGFIERLNKMPTRFTFRVPAHAELAVAIGDGSEYGPEHAWTSDNSADKRHRVATKQPNKLGLYDAVGNVWEFSEDGWINGTCYSGQRESDAMRSRNRPEKGDDYHAANIGLRIAADLR